MLTAQALSHILERHGFCLGHGTGGQRVYYNANHGRRLTAPYHRGDVPVNTLPAILEAADIPRDEWNP